MDLPSDLACGVRRLELLDARLAGGVVPAGASVDDAAWLTQVVPAEAPIGLDPAGVPAAMRAALSRAGLPLAPGGAWRWGREVVEDAGCTVPVIDGAVLRVPVAATVAVLTSLPLKTLRQWVAARTGVRLKIGADVHLRLWPSRAVLISTAAFPLGGFLSGPQAGTRASIYLGVGGTQHVAL